MTDLSTSFDWSRLPEELKQMIFAYCKLDQQCQIKKELYDLKRLRYKKKFDNVVLDLKHRTLYEPIYLYWNNGSLMYYNAHTVSAIGIDYERNFMLGELNNFCYGCKTNTPPVYRIEISWVNELTSEVSERTVWLCDGCSDDCHCCDELIHGIDFDDALDRAMTMEYRQRSR